MQDLSGRARELWRGLPGLEVFELQVFLDYERSVDQEATEEGLELWMTRVQVRQCPVAGASCDPPKHGRFCAHHTREAETER